MITVDFSRLNVRPGNRILDIGCGSGRHTCEAYRLNDVCVTGADLNPPRSPGGPRPFGIS